MCVCVCVCVCVCMYMHVYVCCVLDSFMMFFLIVISVLAPWCCIFVQVMEQAFAKVRLSAKHNYTLVRLNGMCPYLCVGGMCVRVVCV